MRGVLIMHLQPNIFNDQELRAIYDHGAEGMGPSLFAVGRSFSPGAAKLHDETDGGHRGAEAADLAGRLTLMLLW